MISATNSLSVIHERVKNAISLRKKENIPEKIFNLQTIEQVPSIIAVSKLVSAQTIRDFYAAGQRDFGESYIQEALNKFHELGDCKSDIVWHFIGPIQSNKLKKIAQHFDWIHSVDSYKTAEQLSNHRQKLISKPLPINICLQVNISQENSKRGVHPDDALSVATQIATLPFIKLRGLMTIPRATNKFSDQFQDYKKLASIFNQMLTAGLKMDTISAGMSNDFEAAIAAGSTTIRVGSILFGDRKQNLKFTKHS